MLRVTDVLTRNLITAAITHDISMTINRPANYDILTGKMLNTLLNAIRSCGVPFNVWADRKNVFDCTSLMGKEKRKLLENLPEKLENCQPNDFCSIVQQIWKVASYSNMAIYVHIASHTSVQNMLK